MDVSVVRITSLQELQTTIRPELLRGVPLDASRTMDDGCLKIGENQKSQFEWRTWGLIHWNWDTQFSDKPKEQCPRM